MINTILVEDDLYISKHFADILTADGRFYITAAVRDAFDAEKLCSRCTDLVLMDILTLHKHSGLAAGERIRKAFPQTKVVAMTSLVDPEVLEKAKNGGADSLWYKDHGTEEILDVITRTLNGERIFPDKSPSVEMKDTVSGKFTAVQIEILRCYILGFTYKEIAAKFNMSVNGVRWNIDEMVRKGGYLNKEALLNAAIENKLIVTSLEDE